MIVESLHITFETNCQIEFQEKLGEGHFGSVRFGIWRKSLQEKIPCACKTLKNCEKLNELLEEVLNMIKLRHENIVVMYGVVVSKKMTKTNLQIVIFLLIEFFYLRMIDNSNNLSTSLIKRSKNSEKRPRTLTFFFEKIVGYGIL